MFKKNQVVRIFDAVRGNLRFYARYMHPSKTRPGWHYVREQYLRAVNPDEPPGLPIYDYMDHLVHRDTIGVVDG